MSEDQRYLNLAIEIGNKQPEPLNYGAVIVRDGQAIAIEHNKVHETNNPTLHAEISAIVSACSKLGTYSLEGCTLYASHEPCAMCIASAYWAHIDRVVYSIGAEDQNETAYEFKGFSAEDFASKLSRKIQVERISLK